MADQSIETFQRPELTTRSFNWTILFKNLTYVQV